MKLATGIFCIFCSIFGFAEESYLEPLITESAIEGKIKEIANVLNEDYKGKNLVIIANLKGAVCLAADLIRELEVPFSLEFIRCSSYGMRGEARGELTISGLDKLDLEGKEVLIVDDIFDSGNTMTSVVKKVQEKNPAKVKSLVLLEKNTSRRIVNYQPDYVLFKIDDYFVVGYGLDYKEYFRGLKGVYNLVLDKLPENSYARAN
jgi:hypoxanthine phosphoribosyltransferase